MGLHARSAPRCSAYGNTASLAQAISRGITKAGVGVETLNLEQVGVEEVDRGAPRPCAPAAAACPPSAAAAAAVAAVVVVGGASLSYMASPSLIECTPRRDCAPA